MNIIILAAGVSTRLLPLTKEKPKGILPLTSRTSLLRLNFKHISKLNQLHTYCTIIGGHGYQFLRKETNALKNIFPIHTNIVYNPNYQTMNNCYSLYLALKKSPPDDTLVINSDVLYHASILKKIATAHHTALAVDNKNHVTDESMKVYVQNDRITDIHKSLIKKTSYGEYTGLAKIQKSHIPKLTQALDTIIKEDPQKYYEDAFRLLLNTIPFAVINTNDLPWIEIDTHQDLEMARHIYKKLH